MRASRHPSESRMTPGQDAQVRRRLLPSAGAPVLAVVIRVLRGVGTLRRLPDVGASGLAPVLIRVLRGGGRAGRPPGVGASALIAILILGCSAPAPATSVQAVQTAVDSARVVADLRFLSDPSL